MGFPSMDELLKDVDISKIDNKAKRTLTRNWLKNKMNDYSETEDKRRGYRGAFSKILKEEIADEERTVNGVWDMVKQQAEQLVKDAAGGAGQALSGTGEALTDYYNK